MYIPFGGRFKAQYITAVFLGETLAALVPHSIAIAQGVLLPSEFQCQEDDKVRRLEERKRGRK